MVDDREWQTYRFNGADVERLKELQPFDVELRNYGFRVCFTASITVDGELHRNGVMLDFDHPNTEVARNNRDWLDSFPSRDDFLVALAANSALKLANWKCQLIRKHAAENANG